MAGHSQFAEDVELLALGTLEGEERAAMEAHLATCASCRERLEEARTLLAMLALSAPDAAPGPHVREELLARVRAGKDGRVAEALRGRADAASAASRRSGFWNWAGLGWVVATLVIVASTAFVVEQDQRAVKHVQALEAQLAGKQHELERTRAVLDLLRSADAMRVHLISGSAPWPWPEGKVYYEPKKGLLFVANNLPPLDPGKAYQLWAVPAKGAPASAGVFWPDANGNAMVMMPPGSAPSVAPMTFAVTVEPEGGLQAPSGPQVMAGYR